MRTARRAACTAVMTLGLLAGSGTTAFAHECMVSNRSEQAEKAVAHSPMWLSEDMATHEAYEFTFQVVFRVTPTETMLEEAVQMHLDQELQRWVSFFQGHTLLTQPKTGLDNPAGTRTSGDGRGVDHWSDTELGLAMIAIARTVLENRDSA